MNIAKDRLSSTHLFAVPQ